MFLKHFLFDIYLCACAVFEVFHLCCKVMTRFLVNHKVFLTARVDLNDYYIIRHVHNYAFTMVHVWTEKKPRI